MIELHGFDHDWSGVGQVAKSRAAQARERAREVKAKVDAKRAEQDAQIEKYQTQWFVALGDRDEAQAKGQSAEEAMGQAVTSLSETMGLRVDEIAELCDVSTAEIRALKKRAVSVGHGASGPPEVSP